jgi:DNA polymerase-1
VNAASLLRRYGSLENLLAAGRFSAQANDLRLYRAIATMNPKAPLSTLRTQKPTWPRAARLAADWELPDLARRLTQLSDQ